MSPYAAVSASSSLAFMIQGKIQVLDTSSLPVAISSFIYQKCAYVNSQSYCGDKSPVAGVKVLIRERVGHVNLEGPPDGCIYIWSGWNVSKKKTSKENWQYRRGWVGLWGNYS